MPSNRPPIELDPCSNTNTKMQDMGSITCGLRVQMASYTNWGNISGLSREYNEYVTHLIDTNLTS